MTLKHEATNPTSSSHVSAVQEVHGKRETVTQRRLNGRKMEKLITYLLTPCSRVLLDKLTGFQPVKKFPAFYGTRKFITAFTSASHLSLSWARSNQVIPPHPISWRSILIFSPIYAWFSQVFIFLQVSPTNPCIRLFSFPHALHAPTISFFSILSPEQINKSLIMQFSPLHRYLAHLRPKYSPQHPILKHSVPTFLPKYEHQVPSPYKTTGNIIFRHILIFKCLDSKLEDKRFCAKW